jgi:tetratricopeptide (TPR) repeat protein
MSHELQGEEGQDIQTEAKQFLTACPQPGACVYSHITVKHPLPIQPVEQKKHQQNSNNKRSKPAAARTVTVQTGNSYESITTTATATTTTSSSSTTASSTAQSQPQTHLTVGEANYHPPYSQFGSGIEALLLRHYSKTTSTDDNAIPSWYIELGNAHLLNVQSTTTDSPKNDAMGSWYHAELAINAYHQARRHLERKQQSQQGAFQIPIHRELLATTHFQLGEAHASDPAFQHLSQAQEHFHTAKDMFTQLRYEYTEQAGNTASALLKKNRIPAMDKGYADTCTKLGMVLTNQAAANTLVPTGVMQIGGSGGNNNNIDLRDGLGAGFGGGGNDGGGVRVSGDMFGGAAQLDSLEELLAMMQNNQQYSAEAKLKTETQLKEAAEYLDEAIMIYEQYLYQNSNDDNHNVKQRVIITGKDRHDWQTSLGMAYQQAATTRVSGGHLIRAREFMNQGLDLYLQHILPYQNTHLAGAGTVSTNAIIGGFYVTLADTCLKLGDYDAAKENYEKSMIFHRDHGLAAPPFASFGDGEEAASQIDEVIQMHRQQLEEYRRLVKERMTGGSLYYMPQDDGYVAGMISAIGSMYLSKGELERGIGLLEEAIKMFAGVQNIKKNRRGFAEANMNLAMAYFQARRFEESQECHFKALDIFQELYGDGVNPLAQGMEDIEEFLEHAGLGDFADQIKIMLDGSAEEKSSTKVTVDIEKFKSSQKKNETATKPLFEEEKDKTETSSRGTEEL